MVRQALRWLAGAAIVTALLVPIVRGAGVEPSRADAASMAQKVAAINALGLKPGQKLNRTVVTENEVNAYLAYETKDQLPVGLVEPAVSIVGGGRITARAVIDLDSVRKQRATGGALDATSYLSGRVPIAATGLLRTSDGVGRFELESASVAALPIPKSVLQDIINHYSRTQANPAGIGLDAPFALPARIREIQVEVGRATIVQ
jgi:hypothetical protein